MRRIVLAVVFIAVAALAGFAAFALVSPSALAAPNEGLPAAPTLDRSTPKRSLDGFMHAGAHGQFDVAAHYLDLRAIRKSRQAKQGPDLAEKLYYVMSHTPRLDLAKVPDEAAQPGRDESSLNVGTLYLNDDPIPLAMVRTKFDDGVERWLIARGTVAIAPELYAALGRYTWEDRLPEWLRTTVAGNEVWQWLVLLVAIPLAYLLARMVAAIVTWIASFVTRRTKTKADDYFVAEARPPLRLLLTAALLDTTTQFLRLTETLAAVLDHVALTAFIVAIAWLCLLSVRALARWVDERLPTDGDTEIEHRSVRTRMLMLERVAAVAVVVIATALVLMQFAVVRNVGVSLLASAGIAGVVIGFAAQKSLGLIVAGLQLSFTQPIRIGDSVVVEGESGTIEQISLTYVVVRIWDGRGLIVPVTKFLEQTFQNWSKVIAPMSGVVNISCDFRTPIAPVRERLEKVCKASKNWDGKSCSLQVTEASQGSITLRALVSAPTAGALWDLRCEVRESLIALLSELDRGEYLPRAREEQVGGAPAN